MNLDRRLSHQDFTVYTSEQLLRLIAEQEVLLQIETALKPAQDWWSLFRVKYRDQLSFVAETAEEIILRKSVLAEFYIAYFYADTSDIQALLFFMDYIKFSDNDFRKHIDSYESNSNLKRISFELLHSSEVQKALTDKLSNTITEDKKIEIYTEAIFSCKKASLRKLVKALLKAYSSTTPPKNQQN